jgi:hypothetical protein
LRLKLEIEATDFEIKLGGPVATSFVVKLEKIISTSFEGKLKKTVPVVLRPNY